MTFGEALRREREAKGLTREGLAELSGVTFGSIHGYEFGRRAPSFTNVVKLAAALGLTCQAFAGCSDVATPDDGESEPPAKKPAPPSKPKRPGRKA